MSQEAYWMVLRLPEVTAYTIELRDAGAALRAAINSLHTGVPQAAYKTQDAPETWEWLEARHWLTFVVDRTPNRKRIIVTVVESATEG